MIEIQSLTKRFNDIVAVNNVEMSVADGQVFGLLGTNGAGKSTLLRLMAGILQQDEGEINVDGWPVFEQPDIKRDIFYISDDQFFFHNATPLDMMNFWRLQYPRFDEQSVLRLLSSFDIQQNRRISTFSKGMRKQLALFCALAANTQYILCDETFDGLDPVARQAVKSLLADGIAERGLTPVIASHNLRELEDICDAVGLLHRGGLLLSRDLLEMKQNVHKVQVAFEQGTEPPAFSMLDVVSRKHVGRVLTMVIRGSEQQIHYELSRQQPIFLEMLPLSLEEAFISETEVAGYAFTNLTI